MAKTGILSANLGASSNDDLANEIINVQAPTGSIGSLVVLAIESKSATGPKRLLVTALEESVRVIKGVPVATGLNGVPVRIVNLVRDLIGDETAPRKTAPWTASEGEDFDGGEASHVALLAACVELCAAVKPRRSLASMLNAIEDVEAVPMGFDSLPHIEVDQTDDGQVNLVTGADIDAPEVTLDQDTNPPAAADVTAFE